MLLEKNNQKLHSYQCFCAAIETLSLHANAFNHKSVCFFFHFLKSYFIEHFKRQSKLKFDFIVDFKQQQSVVYEDKCNYSLQKEFDTYALDYNIALSNTMVQKNFCAHNSLREKSRYLVKKLEETNFVKVFFDFCHHKVSLTGFPHYKPNIFDQTYI